MVSPQVDRKRENHRAVGAHRRSRPVLRALVAVAIVVVAGVTVWTVTGDDGSTSEPLQPPLSAPALDGSAADETTADESSAEPSGADDSSPVQVEVARSVIPIRGIWLTAAEITPLPQSGPAWESMYEHAVGDWGSPDINANTDPFDVDLLAGALVAVSRDDAALAGRVAEGIEQVIGSEVDRVLPVARNVIGYVIAADLVGYRSDDFDQWLRGVLDDKGESRAGIETLLESARRDPSNHGTHARATVLAIGLYLGDDELVAEVAGRFLDWLGRSGDGFVWGNRSWQADPDNPVGINPVGAVIDGLPVDGVLPDDQRRSGQFSTEPEQENYVWEAMQGATVTAEILERFGYDAWEWEDRAILRAYNWLHDVVEYPAEGDDTWQPWIVNQAYTAAFPVDSPTRPGKNMAFTDWTHGS